MKTLIVGGGAGSWEIRGRQLGAAIGASVRTDLSTNDLRNADVAVVVKRAIHKWHTHELRPTLVWDALDFWVQPDQNGVSIDALAREARYLATTAGVSTIICATQAMADDLGGVYLPHHSRPHLVAKPARDTAAVVAYEGTPKYLGSWRVVLEDICAKLGLAFVVNPPNLSDADILVAFRGEKWDGDVCRRWKSGVKYVNAIAAGRPIITQPHAAQDEIQPLGYVIREQHELEDAIRYMLPLDVRQRCYEQARVLGPRYTLQAIAGEYKQILADGVRRAA